VALPSDIALMHPTLIARPFHREGWVYEEKYDGWRPLRDHVWSLEEIADLAK
jgi:hypothetical protein